MGNGSEKPTKELYAIFCGEINQANTQKLAGGLTVVMANGVTKLHLLFQSWGGFVGDGVFIYNLLRALPIEVVMYNAGQVASAGVIAFLGGKQRKTTATGVFMVHRSHVSPQFATVEKLKVITESLVLDDARSEVILREHLNLPDDLWAQHKYSDVHLSGADGVKFGIADEIANFAPPVGVTVQNALG
jgi:ATP-dependent Clp protease protease subunit